MTASCEHKTQQGKLDDKNNLLTSRRLTGGDGVAVWLCS